MPVTFDRFPRGVDLTRPTYAADPQTLGLALNVHLSRGGDVEQRKAFVAAYDLPAGTHGLTDINGVLYVFGSAVARPAGLSADIGYAPIPHPQGHALTTVLDTDLFGGKVYVAARYANGSTLHWYDGEQVAEWVDGKARGSFYITGGSPTVGEAGTPNMVLEVLVDGVNLLGPSGVEAQSTFSGTATMIANRINSQSHGYKATTQGQQVVVIAPSAGAQYNDLALTVVPTGNVLIGLVTKLSGGADNDFQPGSAVLTFGSKMYSVAGPRLHFSDLFDPLSVVPGPNGAGYADLSTDSAGAEALVGLAAYYSVLAIFADDSLQIWSVDVDDTENQRLQTITDVGLIGSRAIQTWRDGSVLFLSRKGVKRLGSRDSSGRGGVWDFSLPVDAELVPAMTAAGTAARDRALLLTEPEDGRLWCILGERIFVYSEFPDEKVAGWTEYRPGLAFTDYAVSDHRLYLRAGDTLYLYGGADGQTYDTADVRVRLPFIGGGSAAGVQKNVTGFDAGVLGRWDVWLLPDYQNPETAEKLAQIDGPTFDAPFHPAVGWGAFFALELTRASADRGVISNVLIHAGADASR